MGDGPYTSAGPADGGTMRALDFTWLLAGAALSLFLLTALWTVFARHAVLRRARTAGQLWEDTYELGVQLAEGRGGHLGAQHIDRLLDSAKDPTPVVLSLAAIARSFGDLASGDLFEAIQQSNIDEWARHKLVHDDALERIEGLETVEILQLKNLFGEVANLANDDDQEVVRAAVEALVALDPSVAVGVLVGLVNRSGGWVLDTLGRATAVLSKQGSGRVPVARPQWRNAPMLAEASLAKGQLPDAGAASDALSVLIEALDDPTSQRRLAAVNALANTIEHPGAKIALAGALTAPDRMTRFAAASRLAQTDDGRAILHRTAASNDSSDAASMAAEVLWANAGTRVGQSDGGDNTVPPNRSPANRSSANSVALSEIEAS